MGLMSPVMREALRGRDPYPRDLLALDFAGVATGGRQFYKREGIIVPRFEMLPGALSTGHAGFGTQQVNTAWRGFPANAPLTGDGGLLVPEARTALATWQGDLMNAAWNLGSMAREPASDGYVRLSQVGQPSICTISQSAVVSATDGQSIIRWAIIKRGSATTVELRSANSSSGGFGFIRYTWATQTALFAAGAIAGGAIPLSDGSVFLWFQMLTVASDTATRALSIRLNSSSTDPAGSDVFVRGCGAEVGTYPLLAPIFNGDLPATRTAVFQNVSGLVLPSSYVLFAEVNLPAIADTNRWIAQIDDGTNANRVTLSRFSSNSLGSTMTFGTPVSVGGYSGVFAGKLAVRVRPANVAISVAGGALVSTSTTGPVPALSRLSLGNNASSNAVLNGLIRRVRILPDMDDAALQALTA